MEKEKVSPRACILCPRLRQISLTPCPRLIIGYMEDGGLNDQSYGAQPTPSLTLRVV